jgi:WD40 repeat protein
MRTLTVWDAATGAALHTLRLPRIDSLSADFSRVAVWESSQVRIWELATGLEIGSYRPAAPPASLRLSPDGTRVVTLHRDAARKIQRFYVWDLQSRQERLLNEIPFSDSVQDRWRVLADGRRLAYDTADSQKEARVCWEVDLESGEARPLARPGWRAAPLAFAPQGDTYAAREFRSSLKKWDLASAQSSEIPVRLAGLNPMSVSEDGGTILAHDSSPGRSATRIAVHETRTGKELLNRRFPNGVARWWLSPSGRHLVTLENGSNLVTVRDLRTGKSYPLEREVNVYGFSPDERFLVCRSNKDVVLREVPSGRLLHRFRGHTENFGAWAMSPDGRLLATGSADRTIRLWDTRTGQPVDVLRGHTGTVDNVEFSHDGRTLVSDGSEDVLRLWSIAKRQEILRFDRPGSGPLHGFSRDGLLLVNSDERRLRVWSAASLPDATRPASPPGAAAPSPSPAAVDVRTAPDGSALMREVRERRHGSGSPAANLIPYSGRGVAWSQFFLNTSLGAKGSHSTNAQGVTLADIQATGTHRFTANLDLFNISLHTGRRYLLQFRARADRHRTILVRAQEDPAPHDFIGLEEDADLEPRWKAFRYTFTAAETNPDGRGSIAFLMGQTSGRVWIADVLLAELTPPETVRHAAAAGPSAPPVTGTHPSGPEVLGAFEPVPAKLRELLAWEGRPPVEDLLPPELPSAARVTAAWEQRKSGAPSPGFRDILPNTGPLSGWSFYVHPPGGGQARAQREPDGSVRVDIQKQGTMDLYQEKLHLVDGRSYALVFRARASAPRAIRPLVNLERGDYHPVGLNTTLQLTTEWRTVVYTFHASSVGQDICAVRLHMEQDRATVWIADAVLFEIQEPGATPR